MNFYNKYLKYKNKYINLKTSLIGGNHDSKCEFEIICYGFTEEKDTDITKIKISFDYDNYEKSPDNHKIIKNFDIKIKKRNDAHYSSLKLPYNEFIVNNLFFENKLNYEEKDAEFNKLGIYTNDEFIMSVCEKIMISDDFLKVNYSDEKIKRFIESYFRKNNCINLQYYDFFILLKNYHKILELYLYLIIITQYFRIELFKKYLYDTKPTENKKITDNFDNIYSNIPKYLEARIPVQKIEFGINSSNGLIWNNCNKTQNEINGNNFKLIFDSGNSGGTLVSPKFLKFLGILDSSGNINPEYSSNVIKNFIRPKSHGIHGSSSTRQTNIFNLKFKFTDSKTFNDKIYDIYCYQEIDFPYFDVLFGQETMAALYDDGYSIKWHASYDNKYINLNIQKKINNSNFYSDLLLSDPIKNPILKFQKNFYEIMSNEKEFQEFIDYIPIFVIYFNYFINGRFFETSNLNISNIILIKEYFKNYYLNILEFENMVNDISSDSYQKDDDFNYEFLDMCKINIYMFNKRMGEYLDDIDWRDKIKTFFS